MPSVIRYNPFRLLHSGWFHSKSLALAGLVLSLTGLDARAFDTPSSYWEWRGGDSRITEDRQSFVEWTRPGAVLVPSELVCDETAAAMPPRLESLPGDALTENDSAAVLRWTLAQPQVRERLGRSRTRILRMGADVPKSAQGDYHRVTIFIRNYDAGLTHAIYLNLQSGALEIVDMTSLVQPNEAEIAAALALIGNDPGLAPLLADSALYVTGGFFNRAPDPADPCFRDICLHIEVMTARRRGFARRIVVNLSRQLIANRDFQATTDPDHPSPMTPLENR